MKSIRLNHKFSVKSLFLIMVLMFSGFFGQCVMTVEILIMDHHASHSENKECVGVCNIYDGANKEEFASFQNQFLDDDISTSIFSSLASPDSVSNLGLPLNPNLDLVYLPPGTFLEGIRLLI